MIGPLTPCHQRVALVLESVRVEDHVRQENWIGGRPRHSRRSLARAFITKALLNIPTTKDLLERLKIDVRLRRVCGFMGRVPSEATFSRAFAEFAELELGTRVHEAAVRAHFGDRLVEHVSLDSGPVPARERGTPKVIPPPREPQKRGCKKGGAKREPTIQENQLEQCPFKALAELPKSCDHGIKIGPKGYIQHWRGYKNHVLVADGGAPLAFWVTSASMHDSLAAIPLLRIGTERTEHVFYSLMDKAYFGASIAKAAQDLNQVLIIPPKSLKKGDPPLEMEPDRKRRYRNRTHAERFFADLRDNHGGNFIFVKGWNKVSTHLMFGVLAIFGLSILRC